MACFVAALILTVMISIFAFALCRRVGWNFKPKIFILRLATVNVMLAFAAMIVASELAPMKRELVETTPMVSMRSSEAIGGTFLVGYGVESRLIYTFYVRNAEGGVAPRRVQADDRTVIFEDAKLSNQGIWKRYRVLRDDAWEYAALALPGRFGERFEHEFVVPVGSVVQQFSIR